MYGVAEGKIFTRLAQAFYSILKRRVKRSKTVILAVKGLSILIKEKPRDNRDSRTEFAGYFEDRKKRYELVITRNRRVPILDTSLASYPTKISI